MDRRTKLQPDEKALLQKLQRGTCYQQAGEVCGAAGYEIVGQTSDAGTKAYGTVVLTTIMRSLVIACK